MFDAIDITENSDAFFSKKINYFEMQSKVLEQILENEKMRTLFMEERIDDPIFEALTLNHKIFKVQLLIFIKKDWKYLKLKAYKKTCLSMCLQKQLLR